MLMMAIHATLQRMERELYTQGFTHVREKPHANPSPLSPIELGIHRAFDKLIVGDTPPLDIDIIVPADAVPIP